MIRGNKKNKTKFFIRGPNENDLFCFFFVPGFVRTKKNKINKTNCFVYFVFFVQKTGNFKEQNKIC